LFVEILDLWHITDTGMSDMIKVRVFTEFTRLDFVVTRINPYESSIYAAFFQVKPNR